MCWCRNQPNINGQPGYRWNGETSGDDNPNNVRQVDPPTPAEGDTVLFNEPGRCGGIDAHSHHFMLVKGKYGGYAILVRHGCGDERIKLECTGELAVKSGVFDNLDTHGRFWLMHAMWSLQRHAADEAREKERRRWMTAGTEKRIKTRKNRGRNTVKVWIEDKEAPPAVSRALGVEA